MILTTLQRFARWPRPWLGVGHYARALPFFQRMDDYERNELEGQRGRRMEWRCPACCGA
jgi:hypothetical protein